MNNTHKYDFCNQIESEFSWKKLTWHWGLLVLWEFTHKLNLEGLLLQTLEKVLPHKNTQHWRVKVVLQKIFGIFAGYKTDNIDQYIKHDPTFKALLGHIIPKSTVNNTIKLFTQEVSTQLQEVQREIEKYNIQVSNKESVIIDIDTTFDIASLNIEGSSYNTHYGENGYSPILAFDGLTWDFLVWELRPWNYHCSKEALEFLEKQVAFYETQKVSMIVRGDSWFSTPEIYEYLESKNILYYIKMKGNAVLKRKIEEYGKEMTPWKTLWTEFLYKAESWTKERRIVCCIDWVEQETEESKRNKEANKVKQLQLIPVSNFIVTNDISFAPQEVFSMYNGRATIETCIEEWKNWFMMDRLSHRDFVANSWVFQIHLLALQIFQLFRKLTSEKIKTPREEDTVYTDKEHKWKFEWIAKIGRKQWHVLTIQTYRLLLLSIPAIVVKKWRKFLFRFEQTFWWRELYNTTLAKIKLLPRLVLNL